jgi:hypothetical protein
MPVIRDFDRFYDVERAARELVVGRDVLDTNHVKFVDVSDTKVSPASGGPAGEAYHMCRRRNVGCGCIHSSESCCGSTRTVQKT